mmetsp:Transcript_122492/g.305914  ORF Transcript_122492/g.305914 Transcript_122492/m.305914 type:complete len:218 (-) Transcript_122492:422-1075(-)
MRPVVVVEGALAPDCRRWLRIACKVKGPQATIFTTQGCHVRLIVTEQQISSTVHVEVHLPKLGMCKLHAVAVGARNDWTLSPLLCPGPCVAEENLREEVDLGSLRAAIVHRDLHVDVIDTFASVLDKNIKVAVVVEDARVQKLVLRIQSTQCSIFPAKLVVWKQLLGVLVKHFEIAVRRGSVQVVVVVLDILTMIALRAPQAEQPLLQDRISAIPHS